ncbi:hypothetical protein D3C72_2323750 [compost metagenome]
MRQACRMQNQKYACSSAAADAHSSTALGVLAGNQRARCSIWMRLSEKGISRPRSASWLSRVSTSEPLATINADDAPAR